jgi:hypothetical protein
MAICQMVQPDKARQTHVMKYMKKISIRGPVLAKHRGGARRFTMTPLITAYIYICISSFVFVVWV